MAPVLSDDPGWGPLTTHSAHIKTTTTTTERCSRVWAVGVSLTPDPKSLSPKYYIDTTCPEKPRLAVAKADGAGAWVDATRVSDSKNGGLAF